jgi:hypothetical protein
MVNIDIGLFEYDRHNALYYFIMNADEQIYMRYGGRDARGPNTYLNLESFDLALRAGLDQHTRYIDGKLPKTARPASRFPRDVPLLNERIVKWRRCVECHLIDDYEMQELEKSDKIDRVRDMFRYPDIRRIGIHLDIPKGLEVKEATGPAQESGLLAGDLITAVSQVPVLTFGDLQHQYNKVDRKAEMVSLSVERGGNQSTLEIKLPKEWWWTDLYHRFLSIEPLVYFTNRELTDDEKKTLGLDPKGFASEITEVDGLAEMLSIHTLKVADIIFDVDGATQDPLTQNCRLYIKLTQRAGETLNVKVIRDGKVIETEINSERQSYRKESE